MKKYTFSALEFTQLWVIMVRLNSFMHSERSEQELKKYQDLNYQHIHKMLYDILVKKMGDDRIYSISEIDDTDIVDFDRMCELYLEIVGRE